MPGPTSRAGFIATAFVIGLYYLAVLFGARNFPIGDDYALIETVNRVVAGEAPWHEQVYAQHNEHRIVTTKLLFLGYQQVTGGLNFKVLCLLGNLSLAGIFWWLLKLVPAEFTGHGGLRFLLACVLFQYGAAESMLCAMAAVSNYLVLLLAVMAGVAAARRGPAAAVTVVVASILAVFTQGNGLLVPLVAGVHLLVQRRTGFGLLLLALAAGLIAVYFVGYRTPPEHGDALIWLGQPFKTLLFALSFTGSAFGLGGAKQSFAAALSLAPTVLVGLVVWTVTARALLRAGVTRIHPAAWINLFLIASAGMTAVGRVGFGLPQALASRYHVCSALAVICTILLSLDLWGPVAQRTWERAGGWLAGLAAAYTAVTVAVFVFFFAGVYRPAAHGGILFPDPELARSVLRQAEERGIFRAE